MGKKRTSESYNSKFKDSEIINRFLSENKFKNNTPSKMESVYNAESDTPLLGNNTGLGDYKHDKDLNWFSHVNENDVQGSINEFRAQQQSWQDHLGIGALRTVAKAATEVAKLPGVIVGAGIAPFAAENEGFETAFNNQWIKYFDGLNEDVKEALPVYVKESVKNGDFFEKIGSSATWATEGADGAGYMLGALAPGGLFKYFGGAGKLFGASIKAAKLAKYGEGMEAGRKAIKAANITIKNIDQYMVPAFSTVAEAGAESKGVMDSMESRKGEAVTNFKMTDPEAINLNNAIKNGLISEDDYNSQMQELVDNKFEPLFKEQKALAAQNTFFKNVAVLAGPNYIQAKLLFGKTPSKVLLDKIGGLGEKSVKNTFKQGGKNFIKGFASEGAEEIGQSAVENRNVEQGLKFKLGNNRMDDYNPLTFGDDFIKTLGTTEGQMAGFLGGIMGAPMSAVGGYKQDIADRVQTERLREKINGASTAYADIKNTNIYEQEEYTNPETGEVGFRDKEVDGKKVFIPENVAKVKNALNLIEKDSNEYDNAVEDGDVEKIEQFRNKGEFNVIANFIGEDEVTLDALYEHLKVAFPTETSKDVSDEQVKINKTNSERIDKIMSKAKHLQKDLVSFKDMSASILRINHPDITKDSTKEEKKSANEHLEDFLNRTAMTFLSERAEEYEAKQVLSKLEKQRLELENNSSVIEIDNPNYIEGVSSEFDKKSKTRSNNPRLELVNTLIDKIKGQLKGYEENTNSNIWNNKLLNEKFAKEVELRKQIKKDNSPEQVAKNDEVITVVKSSTTEDEIVAVEKNAPKDVIANPIIKAQIDNKKVEIIQAEKVANAAQIANATQEDNDFNNTTTYSDLTGTEGSPVTDELIPTNSENNTAEEVKDIKDGTETVGKGAQVLSTHKKDSKDGKNKSGDALDFIKEKFSNFLKYEKEPVDKTGRPVTFEVSTNPGPKAEINEALNLYNILTERGFNTMTDAEYNLLYDYLPINARFTPDVNAPILTKYKIKDEKTDKWVGKMDTSTGNLRTHLIANLRNGISIENMSTTIQSQYKGMLKVDDNRFANNNILDLDGVPNLKYVRDNLYVVDSFGNLKNIQSGKTVKFINDKIKSNAAGEIYLMIPQANGSEFPLKLNIKKINEVEANVLYEIYKEILLNNYSLETTIFEVSDYLKNMIFANFDAELGIIGGKKNDIKLQDIVDLLIYQSDNVKSQMHLAKDKNGQNVLMYSNGSESKMTTIETINNDMDSIVDYLKNHKRHQIKIAPKFATDNTKTNLKSNNADYLKYLINNDILTTNAVVNEPTFQGYTNIYLNTGITVNNQPKVSEAGVEVNTKDTGLDEAFNAPEIDGDVLDILKEFETEPKVENKSDVETKKADIKKSKRQELLNKSIIYTNGYYLYRRSWQGYDGKITQYHIADKNGENVYSVYDDRGYSVKEGIYEDIINGRSRVKLTKDQTIELYENLRENEDIIKKIDEELKVLENKSETTRNVQESFVSLSEIKGTVENTQLKETQDEVFKDNKKPLSATEQRLINKAITVYQKDATKLTEAQKKRLEEYATNYPESWKKICK